MQIPITFFVPHTHPIPWGFDTPSYENFSASRWGCLDFQTLERGVNSAEELFGGCSQCVHVCSEIAYYRNMGREKSEKAAIVQTPPCESYETVGWDGKQVYGWVGSTTRGVNKERY